MSFPIPQVGAFTEEWGTDRLSAADFLSADCLPLRREAWGVLVDMVAERAVFGREEYAIKKALFLERDPIQQRLLYVQLLQLGGGSPGPQALAWFPPRPVALTDTELGEAERQVAALTPKGREMMQGLFPPEHFAAKLSMRQLVFSVEGSYSSFCSCDSCLRCRTAVERIHRQSHHGGKGGGKGAGGDGCAYPVATPWLTLFSFALGNPSALETP